MAAAAKKVEPGAPTVKAVLAEAKRLRERAVTERAGDPYAKPYEPSDKTARNLSAMHGPAQAIAVLRQHAADVARRNREAEERADRARKRLERQQRLSDAERRHRLSKMTLGQRLDESLAGLITVSEVSAANPEPPISHGKPGTNDLLSSRAGDRAGGLRARAMLLVAEIEDELPRTRQRLIEEKAA